MSSGFPAKSKNLAKPDIKTCSFFIFRTIQLQINKLSGRRLFQKQETEKQQVVFYSIPKRKNVFKLVFTNGRIENCKTLFVVDVTL